MKRPKEEHQSDEEEYEEEEEEEDPLDPKFEKDDHRRRPPDAPDTPPGLKKIRPKDVLDEELRKRPHPQEAERRGGERDRTRHRRRARGGRKHQRLGRLVENPFLPVHRKATEAELQLSSLTEGRTQLDRDIL